jgi:hypothetical protein
MGFSADATRIALPRGKVFFARKSSAGVLGPFLFLGNAPKLDFGTIGDDIAEVVDWTSSTSSPLTRISKKRAPEFPITLMEANPDNLALVFMGTNTEYTQAATAVTLEQLVGGVAVGAIYRLAKPKVATVSLLETVAGTPVVFSATTHYIIRDAESSLIEIVALPATVVGGEMMQCTYTPTAIVTGATAWRKITGGDVSRIEGALLYVGTSATGPRHKLEIWNCSIASDGAFPFIAADPVEFGLKVNVLSDANHTDLFELLELDNGAA